jgi:hypothetical protein
MADANTAAVLTGLGALVAGCGSLFSAISSNKRSKEEGAAKCHEELAHVRQEAEAYGAELHELKMQVARGNEPPP